MHIDKGLLIRAKDLLKMPNDENGLDSTKRKVALQLLAGRADGRQTDRLLNLAIALTEARDG